MSSPVNIGLVGCGKMGSALLRGWLAGGFDMPFHVLEPQGVPPEFENRPHLTGYKSTSAFVSAAQPLSILVIAVKPQIMDTACASIKNAVDKDTLVLSIAAGQTIASFEKRFSASQPVIRAMPNTPASIGKGMTVAVSNKHVSKEQQQRADQLLAVTGPTEWIKDESLLDAVTALSGSGPAYVFYLIEVLAEAGREAGLPGDFAMTLARQTVIGSAALAEHEATIPAATLRQNVTSPGGTTEAALKIVKDSGEMQALFTRALAAATHRGKELSQT